MGAALHYSRPRRRDGSLGAPRWQPAPHLALISEQITLSVLGYGPEFIFIKAPPRHGKSDLASWYAPVWALDQWPDLRVILAGYEASFAIKWSRRARDTIESHSEHRATIDPDHRAARDWATAQGGGMVAAGLGGPITGLGADLLICDDPVKNVQQAESGVFREQAWEWWESTFLTRREPGAVVILIMARWHPDDLMGRALEHARDTGQAYAEIDLPAIAEAGIPDSLGRRPGEALWPSRWPRDALEETKRIVGPRVWASLFQGHPVPTAGGRVFKWGMWRTARLAAPDVLPTLPYIAVGVDPPGGKTLCGIVVGGRMPPDPRYPLSRGIVLDDRSTPGGPEVWADQVVGAYHDWHADEVVAEANYGGDMVRDVIHQRDPTVPVRIVHASRGKRVRAEPIATAMTLGRVLAWHSFPELEREAVGYNPEASGESPNRMDAFVWAMHAAGLGSIDFGAAAPVAGTVPRSGYSRRTT